MVSGSPPLRMDGRPGAASPAITVLNLDSGQKKQVSVSRMMAILDGIGQSCDPSTRCILLAKDPLKRPAHPAEGTLFLDNGYATLIWNEIQKKSVESRYPPGMAPRELGSIFTMLVQAKSEERYSQMLLNLESRIKSWRERDDAHSVRYLENVIRILKDEAGLARAQRAMFEEQKHSALRAMSVHRERTREQTNDLVREAEANANRRIDRLENRIDLSSVKTLLRYVLIPISGAIVTLYGTFTIWLADWSAWSKGGLAAAAGAALIGGVGALHRLAQSAISKTHADLATTRERLRKECERSLALDLQEQGRIMSEMAARWKEEVRRQALELTLKCFDLSIDFFPNYVRSEVESFAPGWSGDIQSGVGRDQARAILAAGLRNQSPGRVFQLLEDSPDAGAPPVSLYPSDAYTLPT